MKKSLFPVVFLCLAAVMAGCKGKTVEPEAVPSEEEPEIQIYEEPLVTELCPSVVLSGSAGLSLLGRDNKMHRMQSLSKGDVFQVVKTNGETDSLNLYEEGNDNPEKYFHAVYDQVDFWIFADYVVPDSVPAIVVESVENLSAGTIIALCSEENQDPENSLAKIFWFNKADQKVHEAQVDSSKISTHVDDVEMAAIIQKLKTTTRATPRNELFLRAEKLNASPAMKKKLDAEKTEKLSYDYQEVLKSMPGARYIVNMEELNTVDQSKDPFSN